MMNKAQAIRYAAKAKGYFAEIEQLLDAQAPHAVIKARVLRLHALANGAAEDAAIFYDAPVTAFSGGTGSDKEAERPEVSPT